MSRSPILLGAAERAALSADAAARPRRRMNRNLHADLSDPIQRLLNALEPGTYVRPHRHRPGVWELFALLAGQAAILTFDEFGAVLHRADLGVGDIIEIPECAWHSLVALKPATVLFEVKPGPYLALGEKDFPAWAPNEGEAGAAGLVAWMERARPGERCR